MSFKTSGNGASQKSITNYKLLSLGDVAFEGHTNKQFSYGRFVVNDTGDGIMSPRFASISPKFKPNVSYWKFYLHNERIMRRVLVKSTKAGTMMNELVYSDLFNQSIKVPNEREQNKIGNFLSKLEDTITLYQRKYDQLNRLKQGLLQKLFPNTKSKQPELRFYGFNKDWEQRKLGEVVKFHDKERIPIKNNDRSNGNYPYYGATGIIDYVDSYIFDGRFLLLAEDGANIVDRSAPITYITKGKFWLNNHAHIMNSNIVNLLFLKAVLDKKDYRKYNSGTAQPKLNADIVKKLPVRLTSKKEQNKIGLFLSCFDNLITLYQSKIDRLTSLKKYLLQQMFV